MTTHDLISVIIGVASVVISIFGAEYRRRIAESKKQGEKDSTLINLTDAVNELKGDYKSLVTDKTFDEFSKRMEKTVSLLFEKLDKFSQGGYQCSQIGMISSHETQITTLTARANYADTRLQEMQSAIDRLALAKANRATAAKTSK